jgi:glucose-6-phosphate isomerase
MLPKINPMSTAAWEKLEDHYFGFEGKHMKELFEKDAERFQKYALKFEDFLVDFSKNIVDDKARELLVELAEECKLKEAVDSMFAGEKNQCH